MANKRFNATITIGGALSGSLQSALATAKGKVGDLGSAVQRLQREQAALNKQIHSYSGYSGAGLSQLITKHGAITKELEKQQRIMAAQRREKNVKGGIADAGMALGMIGAGVTIASFTVRQAMEFEKAMLGVAKQVDGARDSSGKLTAVYFDMAKQIQLLGREIPMSTNSIAEMVAAGARMGVAKDELVEFTKTAAMMAEAFELPAGELAEQMGKIKLLFGLKTQQEVRALADSINYLDDNAISKGGDIIEFLQRTGGMAKAVKITGAQMAALGSTLLALGEHTQPASTAVNAMLQKFGAAEKGSKKMKTALRELGLSAREVQRGMQVDAQATIMKVMEAANRLPAERRIGIMVDLVGLEHSDTISKLAGGVGELQKQVALANSEMAKGSVQREFQARMETVSAQLEIAKNRTNELAVNIGYVLLPEVNKFLAEVGPIVSKTADWARENLDLVKTLLSLGNAIAKISMLRNPITAVQEITAMTVDNLKQLKVLKGDPAPQFDAVTAGAAPEVRPWSMPANPSIATSATDEPMMPPLVDLPPLPKMQPRGGSTTIVDSSQTTVHVHQQPGQDGKALAHEVANVLEQRKAVQRRSRTLDGAGAQ